MAIPFTKNFTVNDVITRYGGAFSYARDNKIFSEIISHMEARFEDLDERIYQLEEELAESNLQKSITDYLSYLNEQERKNSKEILDAQLACHEAQVNTTEKSSVVQNEEEQSEFKVGWIYKDGEKDEFLILDKSAFWITAYPLQGTHNRSFKLNGWNNHDGNEVCKHLILSTGKKWNIEE